MQQRLVDLMVNPDMLAVNQEWAGFAGDRVWSAATGKECWAKPLPGAAVGVVLFNRNGTTPKCEAKQAIDAPCDDWPARMNATAGAQHIELPFDSLPRKWLAPNESGGSSLTCTVFDIFATPRNGKSLGKFGGSFVAAVEPRHRGDRGQVPAPCGHVRRYGGDRVCELHHEGEGWDRPAACPLDDQRDDPRDSVRLDLPSRLESFS